MRYEYVLVTLLLSISAGYVQASPVNCKLADAHYTLSSDKSFRLAFPSTGARSGWISDVALEVRHGSVERYWFLFDQGSARYINLISTTDVKLKGWRPPTDDGSTRPLGEMHFFAWNDGYKFLDRVPARNADAPVRIFLPELPEMLAYRADPRVEMPQGVFVLDGCK